VQVCGFQVDYSLLNAPSFLFILADDWRNSGAIFSHTQRIDCLFLATHLTRR